MMRRPGARRKACYARANVETAGGISGTRPCTTSTCAGTRRRRRWGLIALQQGHAPVVARAFTFLRSNWRLEPGGLTVSQALVAFRLHGLRDQVPELLSALGDISRRASFRERPLAVAWAVLATGPDALLEPLRSRA